VLLVPGGVVDFRNNCLHVLPGAVEAIVETDRIEAEPEIAQVRKDADRALGVITEPVCNQISHRPVERYSRVPQVIPPPEIGCRHPMAGPQPSAVENAGQFGQIQV
jgi:hypothetical protein